MYDAISSINTRGARIAMLMPISVVLMFTLMSSRSPSRNQTRAVASKLAAKCAYTTATGARLYTS